MYHVIGKAEMRAIAASSCRSVGSYPIGKVVVIVPRVGWPLDRPRSVHRKTVG